VDFHFVAWAIVGFISAAAAVLAVANIEDMGR